MKDVTVFASLLITILSLVCLDDYVEKKEGIAYHNGYGDALDTVKVIIDNQIEKNEFIVTEFGIVDKTSRDTISYFLSK